MNINKIKSNKLHISQVYSTKCLKFPLTLSSSHLNVMRKLQYIGMLIGIAPTTYLFVQIRDYADYSRSYTEYIQQHTHTHLIG